MKVRITIEHAPKLSDEAAAWQAAAVEEKMQREHPHLVKVRDELQELPGEIKDTVVKTVQAPGRMIRKGNLRVKQLKAMSKMMQSMLDMMVPLDGETEDDES